VAVCSVRPLASRVLRLASFAELSHVDRQQVLALGDTIGRETEVTCVERHAVGKLATGGESS
jgi:hypothetical protein